MLEVVMVTDQSNYNDILHSRNDFNNYTRNDCFVQPNRYHYTNNKADIIFLKTFRSKSLTATTIYENERRDSFRILRTKTMEDLMNDNNNITEDIDNNNKIIKKNNRKKHIYKSRKHYSDYDIVYLQVENDADRLDDSDSNDSISTDSCDGGAREKINFNKKFSTDDKFRKAKSESNLSIPPSRPLSAGHSRTSSHIDITETKTYKEIYADNLRQYSFLLAKQLGTNLSTDALRKSYLKSRQKAMERRERANTASEPGSRKTSQQELSHSRKSSAASVTSHGSLESLKSEKSEKYTASLTDISSLINEKDLKRPTTVNRRKNKKSIDPLKRLSAPLLNTQVMIDIENDIKHQQEKSMTQNENERLSSTSLSVPDLSDNNTIQESSTRQRKLSNETLRRQKEAKERLEWRMSRLSSFEGVLTQAGDLIKNYKKKASQHSQNNSQTNSRNNSRSSSFNNSENNSKNNSKNNSSTDLSNTHHVVKKPDSNNNTQEKSDDLGTTSETSQSNNNTATTQNYETADSSMAKINDDSRENNSTTESEIEHL